MKKRGFSLIEIILAISLIGVLSMATIPLLSMNYKKQSIVKYTNEMSSLCELVIEKIKVPCYETKVILSNLDYYGIVIYNDEDIDSSRYVCKINKIYSTHRHIELSVEIRQINMETNKYVEIKATIPKK